jgi:hypothetical protein
MLRTFVKSKGGVGFEKKERRKKEKSVSIVKKGPRGYVDSPVSLSAFIDIYSVAS